MLVDAGVAEKVLVARVINVAADLHPGRL